MQSSWFFYLGEKFLTTISPVHLISESRGGILSVKDKWEGQVEILLSSIGCSKADLDTPWLYTSENFNMVLKIGTFLFYLQK